MKETKVYVDELPKNCEKCPLGYFYDCQYCFLRPDLAEKHEWCEKDKHCPLQSLKTHDRELVKEVCEKIHNDLKPHYGEEVSAVVIERVLSNLQKEFKK